MQYVCKKGQPRKYRNAYYFLWVQVVLQRKLPFSHSQESISVYSKHQLRKSRQHQSVDVTKKLQVRQEQKESIIKLKYRIINLVFAILEVSFFRSNFNYSARLPISCVIVAKKPTGYEL